MSDDIRRAWSEVGERFSTLGRAVNERHHDDASGPAAQPGPSSDEEHSSSTETASSDLRAAVRDAFEQLIDAARQFGNQANELARDTEIRARAKHAAKGLTEALSTTANTLGTQLAELFDRPPSRTPTEHGAAGHPTDEITSPTGEATAILDAGGTGVGATVDGEPEIEGPNSS